MVERDNTIEAREESLRCQLAGESSAATAAEAESGLADAKRELSARAYGVGFGYVKSFGSPNGLDAIRLEFVVTDGDRVANVHADISGTQLSSLGYERNPEDVDTALRVWALDRLYSLAGSIPRDADRYATLLREHPLQLG